MKKEGLLHTEELSSRIGRMANAELSASMHVLKSVMGSTEEEFLMLGSRTGIFSDRSEKIVERASSVVTIVSSENITRTIGQLNSLMENVSGYITRSEAEIQDNIRILQDIVNTINGMLGPLGKLQGITRRLRALGISTMIQHASLRTSTEGFRILGEDIRNLSEVVNSHSRTIIHEIQALNMVIRVSISRLQALFDSQRKKASAVLQQTMSSIVSLREKYSMSMAAAQDISVHFSNVTKSIRQIVTMLQFHDIARQQFEAVHQSFAQMTGRLHDDAGRAAGPYDAEKQEAAIVREMIRFCRTQTGRIRQIRKEFSSAIENVRSNLTWIATNMSGVILKTGQVALSRESAIDSFLAHIESTLTAVSSTLAVLSENVLVRKELSDSISPVVNTTGEISAAMREIENIGREIQFISFNSAIKSNHVGRAGRGLGVISAHIQGISSETQSLTSSVEEMLGAVSVHVNELNKHLESHIFTRDDVVQEMSVELKQLIRTLHEANSKVGSTLDEIDAGGMSLSRDISSVVDSIRSGVDVNTASAEILSHLDTLQSRLEQHLRDSGALLYGAEDDEARTEPGDSELRPAGEFGGNVELF